MRGFSRELTWIEWKICKVITGAYLERFNYDAGRAGWQGIGILALLRASVTWPWYYGILALRSRDMRKRLKLYLAGLYMAGFRLRRGRSRKSAADG